MHNSSPSRLRRTGAAAVELAVVIGPILLLIFGVLEYCRLLMVRQVCENAVREGARYAVARTTGTNPSTGSAWSTTDMQNRVRNAMGGLQNGLINHSGSGAFTVSTTSTSDILVYRCSVSGTTPTVITPQDVNSAGTVANYTPATSPSTGIYPTNWYKAVWQDARFGDTIAVQIMCTYQPVSAKFLMMPATINLNFISVMSSEAN
jgi:Flp pilus assembly protein TadG